jgi:hypothetical protein
MDQRAVFFVVAAGMSGLLIPVIEDDLRYVPEIVSVVYVFLAAASYLDWRTKQQR